MDPHPSLSLHTLSLSRYIQKVSNKYDFIVIGAGIVGVATALELGRKHPASKILVIEKEKQPGLHASGRNSGVLHSGIYYTPGSLKAKFSAAGAAELKQLCRDEKLPLAECGKLILPVSEADFATLDRLLERAPQNGVEAHAVGEGEILELEPEANAGLGRGVWVPGTAVSDPRAVLSRLVEIARSRGVEFLWESSVLRVDPEVVLDSGERFSYGLLWNCAGVYADRLAQPLGLMNRWLLVPFRGAYQELAPEAGIRFKRLLYPAPNLEVPFLGVHFTVSTHGSVYVGPNARPALGRENYRGLQKLEVSDLLPRAMALSGAYLRNASGFRNHVHGELSRMRPAAFSSQVQALARRVRPEHLRPSLKRGIRSQLMRKDARTLEMDFCVEKTDRTRHVLNAISPGYTTALPFARWWVGGEI